MHVHGSRGFFRVVGFLGIGRLVQAKAVEFGFLGTVKMFGPFICAVDGCDFGAGFRKAA